MLIISAVTSLVSSNEADPFVILNLNERKLCSWYFEHYWWPFLQEKLLIPSGESFWGHKSPANASLNHHVLRHPQTKLEAVKKSQSFLTDFPEGGLMIQKIKNIHILSMKRYFNFKCSYFISLAAFGITTELCCWVLSVVSLSFQPSLSLGVYFCHAPPPCHGPGSHLDRKALFHVLRGTHSTRVEFLCSHPKAIGGCYCIPLTEKKNINKKKCQPHWLSMHSFSSITEGHCLGLLQHHCLLS